MTWDRSTLERVRNWAAWSRAGHGHRATCHSAEGRYQAPSNLDREPAGGPTIDVRDALHVWRAISPTSGFPRLWFVALSGRFIWGLQGWQFVGYMRRHHVPVGRSDDEHDRLIDQALSAAAAAIVRADRLASVRRFGYGHATSMGRDR